MTVLPSPRDGPEKDVKSLVYNTAYGHPRKVPVLDRGVGDRAEVLVEGSLRLPVSTGVTVLLLLRDLSSVTVAFPWV